MRGFERLHQQYGDYVCLGPTELTIADPKAVKALYSGQARVGKDQWYTALEPRVSLHMVRDKKEHARRRKVRDQGFSSKALCDYEPRISYYTEQLIDAISKNVGRPINMATWFNYYSFDVMGDLSFGKPFNMLIDGKDTYFSQQLHEDMKALGLFSQLTWLFPFFKRVPFVNSAYLKFWTWVDEQIKVFREGWAYGVGTDWAGLLVSRLNNNTRLEKYMQENIFKSLGLEFTSFCLEKHPEIKDNLVGISTRQPDGILVPSPNLWPFNAPDDCSEADLYSTVDDFTKTIGHLVRDSPVLLKKESVQQMFMGQLHEGSSALNVFRGTPDVSRLIGVNDIEKGANDALGGMYL